MRLGYICMSSTHKTLFLENRSESPTIFVFGGYKSVQKLKKKKENKTKAKKKRKPICKKRFL
jgi:hypothetical protein